MAIKAIIGLGNPGQKFYNHRHNIGFRVLDKLAHEYNGSWQDHKNMEKTTITINDQPLILIKPQTFMNDSGDVIPYLKKQGMQAENILVIHDELEKPFGKVATRLGGSARGHNGLRSIIDAIGPDFYRLRMGIGRPEKREDVPHYVLSNFTQDPEQVDHMIEQGIESIQQLILEKEK